MLLVEGRLNTSIPCQPLDIEPEMSGSQGDFLKRKNRFLAIMEVEMCREIPRAFRNVYPKENSRKRRFEEL